MSAQVTVFAPWGERVQVDCYPTPVPGLVITAEYVRDRWCVTHEITGTAVAGMLPDPEFALHVAIAMKDVADWTRSGMGLRADAAVIRAHRRVMVETGAIKYYSARYTPDAALAEAEAGAS